jgi:hypothetical protein
MTNNFEKIRNFLNFKNENDFYFIQIIKRRKENPELKTNSKIVRDIYIYSLEDFDNKIDNIKYLCEIEKARAYIRLNKRDSKKVGLQMLKRITDLIISENYKAICNIYPSVAGEFSSDEDKTWVIDVDDFNLIPEPTFKKICQDLTDLQVETGRQPLVEIIPTKNGIHLITRPFNIAKAQVLHPEILNKENIKKDSPTLLFCF